MNKKVVFILLISLCMICIGGAKISQYRDSGEQAGRGFLLKHGWETGDLIEREEVVLPQENDPVHKEYNKLQKSQGFDLTPFCGKKVTRYTFTVLNHKEAGGKEVRANILFYEGNIIGADICTVNADGFMHGVISED